MSGRRLLHSNELGRRDVPGQPGLWLCPPRVAPAAPCLLLMLKTPPAPLARARWNPACMPPSIPAPLLLTLLPSIPSHGMLQAKDKNIVIKWHLQTESLFFFFVPEAPCYLSFITHLRRGHHSLTTNIWPRRPPNLKQQTNYCHIVFPVAFIFIYFFPGRNISAYFSFEL